jgi:hypothetical protein
MTVLDALQALNDLGMVTVIGAACLGAGVASIAASIQDNLRLRREAKQSALAREAHRRRHARRLEIAVMKAGGPVRYDVVLDGFWSEPGGRFITVDRLDIEKPVAKHSPQVEFSNTLNP